MVQKRNSETVAKRKCVLTLPLHEAVEFNDVSIPIRLKEAIAIEGCH
jgi:hypothetical protein